MTPHHGFEAETLQAEEAREPSDFWLGFVAGAGTVMFWIAVAVGVWL